jgi:nucleoside-diphosphate-sugar epimerase
MRVLVTGGAGFIGSHLVRALVNRHHEVSVLDDFTTGCATNLPSSGVEIIEADLSHEGVAESACHDIDTIFHLAAAPSVEKSVSDPLLTQQNGEIATLRLLRAALSAKVKRIIFASSCSVYGRSSQSPIVENIPLQPQSPYAASKAACEGYLQAFSECFGLQTVSLRFFNVYGPGQQRTSAYAGVLSIFLEQMLNGENLFIFGDGRQTRDFVFVEDIIRASLLAMTSEVAFKGQAINIGSGKAYTLREVIKLLSEFLQIRATPVYMPARVGDIRHSQADISLAERFLGFAPAYDLAKGIREWIHYLRVPGMLQHDVGTVIADRKS